MSDIDPDVLARARKTVVQGKKASASWLQRQLEVPFTVASAIIAQLETDGVVSPAKGNGQREVLWDEERLKSVESGEPVDPDTPDYDPADVLVDLDGEPDGDCDPEGDEPEDDGTDGMSGAAARIHHMADEFVFELSGAVEAARDHMIDVIKSRPKPWSQTSQSEQRDIAAGVEQVAVAMVRDIAEAVAAGNRANPIRMLLTKVAMGNDTVITGKLKVLGEELEHEAIGVLHGALNKHVILVPATVDDYRSGDEAETDPDDPEFGFEGDGDDEDDEPEPETCEAEPDDDEVGDDAVDGETSELEGDEDAEDNHVLEDAFAESLDETAGDGETEA